MVTDRWIIGLASGSGGEGVDAALVETTGIGLAMRARLLAHIRRPHPQELREALVQLLPPIADQALSHGLSAALHRQFGESEFDAVRLLRDRHVLDLQRVMAIGRLGPLLCHDPQRRAGVTAELGMAALLAERTGLTTFSHFRERDIVSGGQGMPITALADWTLFRHGANRRIIIHLGGVTSIVILPPNARPQDVIAFEAGPGTRLLDTVVRQASSGRERCDLGGRHAVQGRCIDAVLNAWLNHPYFSKKPPRSLPRSEFGPDWIAQAAHTIAQHNGTLEDFLCTLSHFVVRCVSAALRPFGWHTDSEIIWLSGGGSRNGLLWRIFEKELAGVKLQRLDDLGITSQARQAVGAALLAAWAMDGIPASSGGTTGSMGKILGQIVPGEAKNWAQCVRWMAKHSSPEIRNPYRAA